MALPNRNAATIESFARTTMSRAPPCEGWAQAGMGAQDMPGKVRFRGKSWVPFTLVDPWWTRREATPCALFRPPQQGKPGPPSAAGRRINVRGRRGSGGGVYSVCSSQGAERTMVPSLSTSTLSGCSRLPHRAVPAPSPSARQHPQAIRRRSQRAPRTPRSLRPTRARPRSASPLPSHSARQVSRWTRPLGRGRRS